MELHGELLLDEVEKGVVEGCRASLEQKGDAHDLCGDVVEAIHELAMDTDDSGDRALQGGSCIEQIFW